MIRLRRLCLAVLVAVVAMTALASAPSMAISLGDMAFSQHCTCSDMCSDGDSACSAASGCMAVCAGVVLADLATTSVIFGSSDKAASETAAALTAVDRPPPLGPPRI